jgi:hypothetical protein
VSGLKGKLRRGKQQDADALVSAAIRVLEDRSWMPERELRQLAEVRAITEAEDDVRRACILGTVRRLDSYYCVMLLSVIGRKRVELTAADIRAVLTSPRPPDGDPSEHLPRWWWTQSVRILGRQLEHAYSSLSEEDKSRVRALFDRAVEEIGDPPTVTRFRMLTGAAYAMRFELIDASDDVGPRLRTALEESSEPYEVRTALLDLLVSFPTSGRPAKKWQTEAVRVVGLLDRPSALVGALLDAALEATDTEEIHDHGGETYTWVRYVGAGNEAVLCAVTTLAGIVGDATLLPQLRRLALKSVTVIGGEYGNPRSLRLANACAQAIADVGAPSSITELLALERGVRHGTLLRQIRKAIDGLAADQGLTRDELLERAVESHGLDADGTRRVGLSRGSALVETDGRSATLAYVDEVGTRRKSVPASVKETDADAIAAVREELKAIRKTIAGERNRLDGLMSGGRRWTTEEWRSLYLDHPITGRLTRALVWGFRSDGEELLAIPQDASTGTTSSGEEVALPDDGEVRLWHPVDSTADDVHAWRMLLLERLVVQPVKQAFRELYVLTPAEQETRVYSNRFAGHVFRQVQARALMKGRSWKPVAVAWWDDGIDHGVARRTFDPFGIRVEFFFDPILDEEPSGGDLWPYCTSDQVRFFDAERDDPMELGDVPRLVFTEAMRDVDLFVGVTSIGADPEWLDRGEGRRFETYWQSYSFGTLTAAGEIRRAVLEQLLPRLAIADRCELEERYLKVRGDLRTYRIHLGSGNILMSPNDQYLCIVAARDGRAEKIFLPFDDDPVLSLVLSKAFMLSNDRAIEDKTITRQIKGG